MNLETWSTHLILPTQNESGSASQFRMACFGQLGTQVFLDLKSSMRNVKHANQEPHCASQSSACSLFRHVRFSALTTLKKCGGRGLQLSYPGRGQMILDGDLPGERMQQLAERLSPSSASLVNSRGISTSTIRRSDEEKVVKLLNHCCSVLFQFL